MEKVTKTCSVCSEEKSILEFYKHPKTKDGFANKCKDCAKREARENRKRREDYYRAYDRVRGHTEKRKKAQRKETGPQAMERARKYILKNPEKREAHIIVGNAVRDGRLIKQPCEICGTMENIQAHHEDYAKPLDVRWLCQKHHMELHRKVKEEEDLAILNNTKKGSRYDE